MKHDEKDNLIFLIIIAGRKQKDALLTALLEREIYPINTAYGRGTVNAGYLMNTLGLVQEKNKTVITCITTHTKADAVLAMLPEQFDFGNHNTGIAFTLPVARLSF